MYPRTPKEERELDVFGGFVAASSLPIPPASIRHCKDPEPDILCSLAGANEYFELSEVLWERPETPGYTLARGIAESGKASKAKADLLSRGDSAGASQVMTAGAFGYPPLLSLRQALERKKGKSYALNDGPCSLLLYYVLQDPIEPFDLLFDCTDKVRNLLFGTPFHTVWLYKHAFANSISIPFGTPLYEAVASGRPVPLKEFFRPEQVNTVIGKISVRDGDLSMAFDGSFAAAFEAGMRALAMHNAEEQL
jgi:hypothetical protein